MFVSANAFFSKPKWDGYLSRVFAISSFLLLLIGRPFGLMHEHVFCLSAGFFFLLTGALCMLAVRRGDRGFTPVIGMMIWSLAALMMFQRA
ncbi:MAG: hypothetical protein NTX72_02570 [Candidatus Uhrbacteria bacterium]|nr:hypothetical protein [Candidatus Uhrbacteria bacterium]